MFRTVFSGDGVSGGSRHWRAGAKRGRRMDLSINGPEGPITATATLKQMAKTSPARSRRLRARQK
jgi:hypothetical protein